MNFRGIYCIIAAPFDENYNLCDEDVLHQIDFSVAAGAHGLVVPVNASEFFTLTDEERRRIVRLTVEQSGKRLPVIAGVAGISTKQAEGFAKYAKEVGADGVIAMPPFLIRGTDEEIYEYYRVVAGASELPVFIQNHPAPMGTPLSAEMCIDIIRQVDNICYVKEETTLSGHMISRIESLSKSLPGGKYKGTMGGKGGRYLIDEYRRGCCGNMPACQIVDLHSQIWNYLEAGEQVKAEKLFDKILPLINLEFMFGGFGIYKAVLKYRGIIRNTLTRIPGVGAVDELDQIELNRIIKKLKPLFRL